MVRLLILKGDIEGVFPPAPAITFSPTMGTAERITVTVYHFKTFKKVMNVQTPKEKSALEMWFMIENSNNIRL